MNLKNVIIFAAGAAVGSAVAWYVTKTKYEQIIEETVDEIRELYSEKEEELEEEIEKQQPLDIHKTLEKPDLQEYAARLKEMQYNEEENGNIMGDKPYVIAPEDYDELDDYEAVTLTYYADGVVVYDDIDVLSDEEVEEIIGHDSLNHFGEYAEDAVYVRNDSTKGDYEILRDERNYADIHPQEED